MPLNVVLFQPEIPPNTGNIIRLCANTGCALHLIEPLGFDLEDKKMRRAGLDYGEYSSVNVHEDLESFRKAEGNPREFALSTRGSTPYTEARFTAGDAIIFTEALVHGSRLWNKDEERYRDHQTSAELGTHDAVASGGTEDEFAQIAIGLDVHRRA